MKNWNVPPAAGMMRMIVVTTTLVSGVVFVTSIPLPHVLAASKNGTDAPTAVPKNATTAAPSHSKNTTTSAPHMHPPHFHPHPHPHPPKNTTTPAPVPTPHPPNATTMAPQVAPSVNTDAPKMPPTPTPIVAPTLAPIVAPTTTTPTLTPPSPPSDDNKYRKAARRTGKAMGMVLLIVCLIWAMGVGIYFRFRIYYFLREVWYGTRRTVQRLSRYVRGRRNGSMREEVSFDQGDPTEGLLLRGGDSIDDLN